MKMIVMLLMISIALVSSLLAVTSRSAERLLWGTVLCSMSLGIAVQMSSGSYYGLMMATVFLITDLIVYLFFRTLHLLPKRPSRNQRTDWIFRLFFLWIAFCSVTGGAAAILLQQDSSPWGNTNPQGIALLHERIWGTDWLLVVIPILMLVSLVTGGFFLVRKEK